MESRILDCAINNHDIKNIILHSDFYNNILYDIRNDNNIMDTNYLEIQNIEV